MIDHSLAAKYELSPGDAFVISDFEFRIAGITRGAAAFFTPFAFIRYDDLIDFYFESDIAADISTFPLLSFLFVELAPGAVAEAIEAEVRWFVGVDATTRCWEASARTASLHCGCPDTCEGMALIRHDLCMFRRRSYRRRT